MPPGTRGIIEQASIGVAGAFVTLAIISAMAVVIVWIIGTGLGIDVVGCLTGNVFGQILLFITGILYLMVGIKMFGTDKIGG